jgi:hypothetical protein
VIVPEKVPESAAAAPTATRKAVSSPARASNLRVMNAPRSRRSGVPKERYNRELFAANLPFFD